MRKKGRGKNNKKKCPRLKRKKKSYEYCTRTSYLVFGEKYLGSFFNNIKIVKKTFVLSKLEGIYI